MINGLRFQPKLASYRWIVVLTVMMVAVLEVLDSTIVNVALPNMMPALGANREQITWVLTAYVISSAMIIPLTGCLNRWLGDRRLLIIGITGFMLSSVLCGAATSLSQMMVYRLLQGAFGAVLIPLSQSILRQHFPPEQHGKAMAIWGVGIMTAPILGPLLGGVITAHATWRWVFYVNTPGCLISLILACFVIRPTKPQHITIDTIGILLLFTAVGILQWVLDQGNSHGWFSSNLILLATAISGLCFAGLIYRCHQHAEPIIDLSVFTNTPFRMSTTLFACFAGLLFGNLALQPIFMEGLLGYTPLLAGTTMAPLGITSAISMMLSAKLMRRCSIRQLLITASLLSACGTWQFSHINLMVPQSQLALINCVIGFGLGLFIVPLSTHALSTIAKPKVASAAGLYSYSRMLGASLGISLCSTFIGRNTQAAWHHLSGDINPMRGGLQWWLEQHHMLLKDSKTIAILEQTLYRQSSLLAFAHAYTWLSLGFLVLAVFAVLIRPTPSITPTHT